MQKYLLTRFWILLLTLFVVSLFSFALSKMAPGDPVEQYEDVPIYGSKAQRIRSYKRTAQKLGVDRPLFYFQFSSAAYPDTLYRVTNYYERETIKRLIARYGNWELIQDYWHKIHEMEGKIEKLPDSLDRNAVIRLRQNTTDLFVFHKPQKIDKAFKNINAVLDNKALYSAIYKNQKNLADAYQKVVSEPSNYKHYLPKFAWHGLDNQYHIWFSNFFTGHFGYSYQDNQKIETKIWSHLRWTLLLNILALLIVFSISIPIGVYSAVYQDSWLDRWGSLGLFMLYSLPSFWIATLLIIFFTTPEYGMDWFPTYGLGDVSENDSFWDIFWMRAYHLVLPVFCMSYASLAFVSRQMRGGMIEVFQQDYIRTARAKGLLEKLVIWKHTFRNALFPIITLVASIFPGLLAGSLVIEVIFSIPGMGKLTIDAIYARDWPVVYTILMFSALMTMIGILIADLLYAWADPRVSFAKKEK